MNGQVLHAFKKCLRLKLNLNDNADIKQWCRVGIVLDSEIPEVKYLLELTAEGFIKNEFLSRILEFKNKGQIFAVKRYKMPLSQNQQRKLRSIAEFLVKDLGPKKENYKRFYDLTEDDLEMTHESEEVKSRLRRRK